MQQWDKLFLLLVTMSLCSNFINLNYLQIGAFQWTTFLEGVTEVSNLDVPYDNYIVQCS